MTKSVQDKITALKQKAKIEGKTTTSIPSTRRRSSLHQIIKTKEQAELFMKLLQSL